MAAHKVTRSRARKKVPYRRILRFPQIKGKIIADVELSLSPEYRAVDIRFEDKTSLTFDLQPCFQVTPVLADWKTGDYKLMKRWRPVRS
jgi:hypothetical protein